MGRDDVHTTPRWFQQVRSSFAPELPRTVNHTHFQQLATVVRARVVSNSGQQWRLRVGYTSLQKVVTALSGSFTLNRYVRLASSACLLFLFVQSYQRVPAARHAANQAFPHLPPPPPTTAPATTTPHHPARSCVSAAQILMRRWMMFWKATLEPAASRRAVLRDDAGRVPPFLAIASFDQVPQSSHFDGGVTCWSATACGVTKKQSATSASWPLPRLGIRL